MSRLEVAALIAGGKSRRMGRDKALLEWEGKPLWRYQLEKLQALDPKKLAVAAPERPAWLPQSITWLQDKLIGQNGQIEPSRPIGPLGGLLAGMESAQEGLVAVLAVDLPSLSSGYLERLFASCEPSIGVVPQGPFGYEPLAAIYPACALKSAREWATQGHHDLQGLVAHLVQEGLVMAHPVPSLEQPFFRNLNTPADLLEAGSHA